MSTERRWSKARPSELGPPRPEDPQDFPADAEVLRVWSAAVVPAPAVTVQSPTAVLVALPVAWPLLTPDCRWEQTYDSKAPFPEPNCLLRLLLSDVVNSFNVSQQCRFTSKSSITRFTCMGVCRFFPFMH